MSDDLAAADAAVIRGVFKLAKPLLWLSGWGFVLYASFGLGMLLAHLMMPVFRAMFG